MSGSDTPGSGRRTLVVDPDASAVGPQESSALLNLLPHILRMLKREPALGITLGYLLVAMAGIFYNCSFYQKFGIPVLTLSQISDFLAAGIQQPMALLLVLSTLPICWLFDMVNRRSRRRHAAALDRMQGESQKSVLAQIRVNVLIWRVHQRWYTYLGYAAVIGCYGWMFVRIYAEHQADTVKRGDAPQVTVWLNGDSSALHAKSATWTYLGAVSNYVFVYDAVAGRAVVLPVNNIARIEPVLPAAESGDGSIVVAPIP